MRVLKSIQLLAVLAFFLAASAQGNAQQMITAGTKKPEEMMAVINANGPVATNDITVARFRFLLSALSSASGETETMVADKLSVARRELREQFGKNVGLLDLTEAAYRAREAVKKNQLDRYIAQLVVLIGAK